MTLVYRHTIPRKRRRPGGYVSEEDNR
jgi:hypothetical protein